MTAPPDRLPEVPLRYFSFIVFLYSFFHFFLEIIILYTKMITNGVLDANPAITADNCDKGT